MSDLDVSLRLRLNSDIPAQAPRSVKALQGLKAAADRLGQAGVNVKIVGAIKKIGDQSDGTKGKVDNLRKSAIKLGQTTPGDGITKGVRKAGAEADTTKAKVEGLRKKAVQTGQTKPGDQIGQSLRKTGDTAEGVKRKFEDFRRSAEKPVKVPKVENLKQTAEDTSALALAAGSAVGPFQRLGPAVSSAFLAIASCQSIKQAIQYLGELEAKVTAVQRAYVALDVTAEERDPVKSAAKRAFDTRIGQQYGMTPDQITPIRAVLGDAGVPTATQNQVLPDILKASKTFSDSATDVGGLPTNIANTIVAAIGTLNLRPDQAGVVVDQLSKGTKLGAFEANSVAKFIPEFSAAYAKLGFTGPEALAEIISMAQVARKGSGTSDDAATNLRNFYSKLTAPETTKNFAENGVDLAQLRDQARREGKSYPELFLNEMQRLTGGDPFKMGELVADQQASGAITIMLLNRQLLSDWKGQILNDSKGTVDKDYQYVAKSPAEQQAQADAVTAEALAKAGEAAQPVVTWWKTGVATYLNPEGMANLKRAQRAADPYTNEDDRRMQALQAERTRRAGLSAAGTSLPSDRQIYEMPEADQAAALRRRARDKAAQDFVDLQRSLSVRDPGGSDPAMAADRRRLESLRREMEEMDQAAGAAGKASMDAYNKALDQGGQAAATTADRIRADLEQRLNFTARPTISPQVAPPAAAPTAPGKISYPGSGGAAVPKAAAARTASLAPTITIHQTINGGNARDVADRAARQTASAISRELAGMLHDSGSALA